MLLFIISYFRSFFVLNSKSIYQEKKTGSVQATAGANVASIALQELMIIIVMKYMGDLLPFKFIVFLLHCSSFWKLNN